MFEAKKIPDHDLDAFYKELTSEARALMEGPWFTALSNVSAVLMQHLRHVNWVGFYLFNGKELLLGPFQGLPACLFIPMGKGVCGQAASRLETLLVDDVDQFEGHIACDAASQSELVIPLVHNNRLLGVLDIDSPLKSRFSKQDRDGLERIAHEISARLNLPETL